jgi:hypothetical protein
MMEAKIGEKTYILEYTRTSLVKAEEAFNISILNTTAPATVKELITFMKALLYGGLIKNHKNIAIDKMDDVLDEFTGENGYEQEALIEGLVEMIGNVLNPLGGGRKKKLLKK